MYRWIMAVPDCLPNIYVSIQAVVLAPALVKDTSLYREWWQSGIHGQGAETKQLLNRKQDTPISSPKRTLPKKGRKANLRTHRDLSASVCRQNEVSHFLFWLTCFPCHYGTNETAVSGETGGTGYVEVSFHPYCDLWSP